ncbi:MAG: sulfotransferase [Prochloraceae cyanobacterium]
MNNQGLLEFIGSNYPMAFKVQLEPILDYNWVANYVLSIAGEIVFIKSTPGLFFLFSDTLSIRGVALPKTNNHTSSEIISVSSNSLTNIAIKQWSYGLPSGGLKIKYPNHPKTENSGWILKLFIPWHNNVSNRERENFVSHLLVANLKDGSKFPFLKINIRLIIDDLENELKEIEEQSLAEIDPDFKAQVTRNYQLTTSKTSHYSWEENNRKKNVKLFCIGFHKTGLVSLLFTLNRHGFRVPLTLHNYWQRELDLSEQDIRKRFQDIIEGSDYTPLFDYCDRFGAFIDIPFCVPKLYEVLNNKFPNSLFLLTVRQNADTWFNSMFYYTMDQCNGDLPTSENIEKIGNIQGLALDYSKLVYDTDKTGWFNREVYKKVYTKHILEAQKYFQSYKDKLLTIDVSNPESYLNFCNFLKIRPILKKFPNLNLNTNKDFYKT